MRQLFYLSFIAFFAAWGCSSSGPAAERDRDRPYFEREDENASDAFSAERLDEMELVLFENRSSLTDEFSKITHEIPAVFEKEITQGGQLYDEFVGYRVQILSTRDVVLADSTKDSFSAWADSTFEGYHPEAYVLFRQPYYRVKAGDFRSREKANEFSRMIKEKFPGAWVVHDRIDPDKIPSDTTRVRLRESDD